MHNHRKILIIFIISLISSSFIFSTHNASADSTTCFSNTLDSSTAFTCSCIDPEIATCKPGSYNTQTCYCQQPPSTYNVCSASHICQAVSGTGSDLCQSNTDCATPTPTPTSGSFPTPTPTPTLVCTKNSDCNDSNACTSDICFVNTCVNSQISPCSVSPTPTPTPSPGTLSVNLQAATDSINYQQVLPSDGVDIQAPLNGVDLQATVTGGTGNITYKYYCDAPTLPGANVTPDATFTGSNNPYSIADVCNYATAGTYTARVVITRYVP